MGLIDSATKKVEGGIMSFNFGEFDFGSAFHFREDLEPGAISVLEGENGVCGLVICGNFRDGCFSFNLEGGEVSSEGPVLDLV